MSPLLLTRSRGRNTVYLIEVTDAVLNARYAKGTYYWHIKPSTFDPEHDSSYNYDRWRKVKNSRKIFDVSGVRRSCKFEFLIDTGKHYLTELERVAVESALYDEAYDDKTGPLV